MIRRLNIEYRKTEYPENVIHIDNAQFVRFINPSDQYDVWIDDTIRLKAFEQIEFKVNSQYQVINQYFKVSVSEFSGDQYCLIIEGKETRNLQVNPINIKAQSTLTAR